MKEAILRGENSDGKLCWRVYRKPVAVLTARSAQEVTDVLLAAEIEAAKGRFCVGFVAYEAAPAFDQALTCHPQNQLFPCAEFGVYEGFDEIDDLPPGFEPQTQASDLWLPDVSQERYEAVIQELRSLIGDGDTYQVNYTFRLRSAAGLDPRRLFGAMASCPRTRYSACLDTGRFAVCSASPELFFELESDQITTRPMKGTAPRGRTTAEDGLISADLSRSEKNRAENLMIVDMVRNDLGRIAKVGSVRVTQLFEVERYSTVHQMTSTVEATTVAPLVELFRALFPASSVTGAPKKRTMEIIRDFEQSPRGVYTGCVGVIGPGRRARFNVAIRTAVLDRERGEWEYGVGGGVVWDSTPRGEYDECRNKAQVLASPEPFRLVETLRWTPEEAFFLLERHLDRLMDSALYFDFDFDGQAVRSALCSAALTFPTTPLRVRLLAAANGDLSVESQPLTPWPAGRKTKVGMARTPVDPQDRYLFHKTTRRSTYDLARSERPDCDEVLLWNRDGFLTEGTFTNVAVLVGGRLLTPPIDHGLLPGVMRAEMIATGELTEAPIRVSDISPTSEVYILNSVRGMALVSVMASDSVNLAAARK